MTKDKDLMRQKVSYKDMREVVERSGETYADRIAYSYRRVPSAKEAEKVGFTQFRDDIRALTTEFISRGYSGKHIAVIGKNSYEWVMCYFATLCSNSVLVPLDREWHAPDLADTVLKAECEVLICDTDFANGKGDAPAAQTVITDKTGIKDVFYLTNEGEGSVGELIKAGREKFNENSDSYFNLEINPDKLSLLVFTSGTTGKGKGVMLTQTNVISDMCDVIPYVDIGAKTVSVLPPHHTFGSSIMIAGHCMIGCEVYISAGLRYIQKELKEEKPEHLILVPLYLETFYRKILANIKAKGKEKSIKFAFGITKILPFLKKKLFAEITAAFGGRVKMIICGGAPLNREIADFYKKVGISIINGYGITECAPIISVNHSLNNIMGSVGIPVSIDDVKIAEPNEDNEGEICVKGSNVMLGYYKDEEATKDAFDEDGYFKTGDYGKIEKRAIFITGRKKNLIILSNGKNVYPEEIETELNAVPGILDIIVYEGQSRRGMEFNTIVAEVYPDNEYVSKNGIEDVKAYLQPYVDAYNKTAVPYKKIGLLKVREEEFPKNTLRKIMRFKLDMTID